MKYTRIEFSRNTHGYLEEARIDVSWGKSCGYWVFYEKNVPYLHTGGGGGKGTFRSTKSARNAVLKLVAEIEKEGYVMDKGPYNTYEPVVRIGC